jgi:hypothetical protein
MLSQPKAEIVYQHTLNTYASFCELAARYPDEQLIVLFRGCRHEVPNVENIGMWWTENLLNATNYSYTGLYYTIFTKADYAAKLANGELEIPERNYYDDEDSYFPQVVLNTPPMFDMVPEFVVNAVTQAYNASYLGMPAYAFNPYTNGICISKRILLNSLRNLQT